MMKPVSKILTYAETLRFPWLVLLIAVVFVANVLIPDVIPFVDEILLGLLLAAVSRLRKPKRALNSSRPETGILPVLDTSKRKV